MINMVGVGNVYNSTISGVSNDHSVNQYRRRSEAGLKLCFCLLLCIDTSNKYLRQLCRKSWKPVITELW